MRLFLFLLLFCSSNLFAQDFDVYQKKQDDKVKLPYLHESVQFKEFQVLSREIRMMDMAYAVIVPGYVHFKAKNNKIGYWLIGIRSIAYIGLGSVYIEDKMNDNTYLGSLTGTNTESNTIQITDKWTIESSDIIFTTSVAIIIGTYLYDWIHGKALLERKQENIRYKYAIKLKLERGFKSAPNNDYIPSFSFSYSF